MRPAIKRHLAIDRYSGLVVLGAASGQINMRKVDGWQSLATKSGHKAHRSAN
jgi:hypothetical protein